LCLYLLNVKKLEYEESCEILKKWLEKCNNSKKLDFNPDVEIKAKLRYVKHYNPISIKKMKDDNKNLNLLLRQKL
jgi:glutamate mutase epsilon subunit